MKTPKQIIIDLISNLNLNLIVTSYGNELAVGFEGTDQRAYNLAYNYGATSGEAHELSPSFHYFLASEEGLASAITTYILAQANKGGIFPSMDGGIIEIAKKIAVDYVMNLPRENFLGVSTSPYRYAVLDGGAPDREAETED